MTILAFNNKMVNKCGIQMAILLFAEKMVKIFFISSIPTFIPTIFSGLFQALWDTFRMDSFLIYSPYSCPDVDFQINL